MTKCWRTASPRPPNPSRVDLQVPSPAARGRVRVGAESASPQNLNPSFALTVLIDPVLSYSNAKLKPRLTLTPAKNFVWVNFSSCNVPVALPLGELRTHTCPTPPYGVKMARPL